MLVKLSGERYINPEHIESVQSNYAEYGSVYLRYEVVTAGGDRHSFTQTQFDELTPYLSIQDAEGERKRKVAREAVIERVGRQVWYRMSEDEQDDALNAEVAQ